MSVLSQPKDTLTATIANTDISSDWGTDNKVQEGIMTLALKKMHSLLPVRKKKIFEVRRQLVEGRYDLEERLNSALDRLLEDLID